MTEQASWFLTVLTLIFITLKLCGKITWAWLWVLSPMWVPAVIGIGILILTGIVVLGIGAMGDYK